MNLRNIYGTVRIMSKIKNVDNSVTVINGKVRFKELDAFEVKIKVAKIAGQNVLHDFIEYVFDNCVDTDNVVVYIKHDGERETWYNNRLIASTRAI